jgi:hypothetical protein
LLLVEYLLTNPDVSHALFGAFGGVLYILRQLLKRNPVGWPDMWARPIFGGVSAVVLTVWLGLPNHMTSLFVGFFGVSIWDALADRVEPVLKGRLPFSPKP